MPRVAVVVPTYNRRAMVREAVHSVLAQSERDFELIVVDDGSEDETAAAIGDEFGSAVRLIRTPHRGVSAARNAGAAESRAPLITFLDSDDLWDGRKLAAQLDWFAVRPAESICQTEEVWIRNGARVNPCRHHRKREGDIFVSSLELCLISPSAVMLRRGLFEQIGGFDESLPACEDYDLWLRIARIARIGLLPQALVTRRAGHADQLSRRFWGMDRFRVASLCKLLAEPLAAERRQAAIAVLRRKCAILAQGAEKRGRLQEAERYRSLADVYV